MLLDISYVRKGLTKAIWKVSDFLQWTIFFLEPT